MQKDIFEELTREFQVGFLSELCQPKYYAQLGQYMAGLRYEDYPLSQLEDAAHYFFGQKVSFSSYGDAEAFYTPWVKTPTGE